MKDKCLVNTTTIPRPILFLDVFVYIPFGASVTIVTKWTTKAPCPWKNLVFIDISKFDVSLLACVPYMLSILVCFDVLRCSALRLKMRRKAGVRWQLTLATCCKDQNYHEMHRENDKSIGTNGHDMTWRRFVCFPGHLWVFRKKKKRKKEKF